MVDLVEYTPTDQQCRDLVQRIIASGNFRKAARLRDFLSYVVDRKLAAATQEATEPLIGHRVFGRPASYNTGDDSIVRTEARLLRQRLERYFSEEGANEPIVLEIPKGCYVPVFYRREQAPAPPPPPEVSPRSKNWRTVRYLLLGACLLAVGLALVALTKPPHSPTTAPIPLAAPGGVQIESSDPQLVRGFEWAKEKALGYTYTGDAIGDWYESTVGTRYAFCMRDVAHQSTGAAVLGLTAHTRNMLHRFAASISDSRDWCGFWEINKDGFPAPIDYQDDRHFWYCLPANFDVMRASYRQFLWTGDQSYFDSTFSNFYDRTVTDYVTAWDRQGNGLMQGDPKVRPRGIASYGQQQLDLLVGADLLAAQYAGYLTYAAIEQKKGARGSLSSSLASEYLVRAQDLRARYNAEWWDPARGRHHSFMRANHRFDDSFMAESDIFALLFGLSEDGLKTKAALDSLENNRPEFDQQLSYYPEVLFQYGRNESAYRYLLKLSDPHFQSRGMPEVAFAVVGATATGLAGISPNAGQHMIETVSRLPKSVAWLELAKVPVFGNLIGVRHQGKTATTFTNQAGAPVQWKAGFVLSPDEECHALLLDGRVVEATVERAVNQQRIAYVVLPVGSGETRTVKRELTVN